METREKEWDEEQWRADWEGDNNCTVKRGRFKKKVYNSQRKT